MGQAISELTKKPLASYHNRVALNMEEENMRNKKKAKQKAKKHIKTNEHKKAKKALRNAPKSEGGGAHKPAEARVFCSIKRLRKTTMVFRDRHRQTETRDRYRERLLEKAITSRLHRKKRGCF